ncbi:Scramblase-domain-containing protein [Rhizodiscina lignyota]|uniref:Scramblase-domain-containing protein n=1 Tax=Rhizodiscina lignyota TaxID=1504668 RepID=A0A9P4I9S6_9PEZI|nr:Scramblase-domain-containing protein [Rhizodiscina lignyota]
MSIPSRWAFRLSRSVPRASRLGQHGQHGNPTDPQSDKTSEQSPSRSALVSQALRETAEDPQNRLLSPVNIPEDPHAILRETHPAVSILANSTIVVQRQLEMMNVFLGFEQANRYIIMDPLGNHIGYLAEQEHGMGNMMARQMLRTHRSFTTHVFDRNETEVLRFHRPLSWISSRIKVYDAVDVDGSGLESSSALQGVSTGSISNNASSHISSLPMSSMRLIGEAQQQWAPLRRKYNLFLHRPESALDADPSTPQLTSGDLPLSNSTALEPASSDASADRSGILAQFAYVNEPFLSWDFTLLSADNAVVGSVNRNFAGWGRELFTDTGVYALRMDSESLAQEPKHLVSHTARKNESGALGMTLDQRAIMLATAVSIDFDYFSRHSHAGAGGFMPIWIGGGEAAGGAAGAEAGAAGAGAVGEAGAAGAGAVGRAAGGAAKDLGVGEGAIAGAGTMAGYEAMQRGMGRRGNDADDASPVAGNSYDRQDPQTHEQQPGQGEEVWGEEFPWSGGSQGGDGGGSSSGGGGGDGSWFDSFFGDS